VKFELDNKIVVRHNELCRQFCCHLQVWSHTCD